MAAVLDNEKISHLCVKNTGYLLRTRPERSTVTFQITVAGFVKQEVFRKTCTLAHYVTICG